MSNPPKQKGTAYETAGVNYLKQFFPDARRNALAGRNDKGDIAGCPLPLEFKNVIAKDFNTWLKEAEREAENAGAQFCPVVHKRRGVTDMSRQYVLLELWMLVDLMLAWEAQNS